MSVSDGTHDCSQTCTNTIASYICGYNTRYLLVLGTDGITCIGMCTCTECWGYTLHCHH